MGGVWLASEGADEEQETGARQMKIGDECIDHFELVRWVNENVGGAFLRLKLRGKCV